MKNLFIIFLFMIVALRVTAQDSAADTTVTEYNDEEATDSVAASVETPAPKLVSPDTMVKNSLYGKNDIKVRKFDQHKWDEIVKGVNYDEKVKAQSKKALPSFHIPWSGPVVRIIAYLLVAGLIVFIIYYLLKNITWSGTVNRQKMTAEDFVKPVEDIKDLDFESLLQEALASANYKLAIRIYYLGLLKKLNEGGQILWKKDKTNRDYLSELFARSYHFEAIKSLTLAYENVWYGEHTPTTESFQRIRENFEVVHRQLNSGN